MSDPRGDTKYFFFLMFFFFSRDAQDERLMPRPMSVVHESFENVCGEEELFFHKGVLGTRRRGR